MLQQKANQYKKLWEKIEIFSFQMEMEGKKYDHVLYQRFNKPTGILIVEASGAVIPYEKAKQIVAPMNYYNNIAKGAATDLVREKSRDISPMEDLQQFLQEHPFLFPESPSMTEDYQNVQVMLETLIDGQKRLHRIFEDLKAIDIEAREKRRCIKMGDVEKFLALNEQYQSILYRQGRMQQETRDSIGRLARYLREKAAASRGSKQAMEVLTSFLSPQVTRALDESLATFEKGADGRRVHMDRGEAGVQQMLGLYRKKTEWETEKILYALLRNP